MRSLLNAAFFLCALATFAAPTPALAQTAPASAAPQAPASPPVQSSPSPAPSQRPGTVRFAVDAHTTFISQGTHGPGIVPPEAGGFANGDPLSPLTPYEVFSSAPLVPGNALESALYVRPAYAGRTFDAGVTLGLGYVRGSTTNAVYWGESPFAPLNPHLGAQRLPYRVTFPTHAGSDDGTGFVASILSGTVLTKDGNLALRAGWFDLAQTAQFVFVQPAITGALPSLGMTTPESLGDGTASLDAWQPSSQYLLLHGIDLVGKHGLATVELTSATLPSLPGTSARMNMASVVVDHGEGTRYTAQYLHVATGGDLISTTILYGGDNRIEFSPQGPLPASMIGGQRQRIFGLGATFHATKALDAVAELGHSTYDADHVAQPGTGKAGNYAHLGISRTTGRATASLDFYRNEAYYAQELLPYGAPENVWSIAWSWPGQWLKSNYQLINDFPVNIDRQGYRVRYALKGGGSPLDVRASYANFGQIEPITYANALKTGFVDGFFLPQPNNAATLGRQHQFGLFVGWHPAFADLTIDYAEDTMRRRAVLAHPEDTVSYDNPEVVLTLSRHVDKNLLVSAGVARYGMRGSFGAATTNVDFAQRTAFAGLQLAESARTTSLLTLRRSALAGIPSRPGGPPPDFTGTLFVFEQRYRL
ncbi:MAG TPA: hypothetical protein VGX96_12135 [Candidatus Elarobacter sp.]|nr:hypothetical protein [Candidatus Elarobacter sp.]